MPAKHSAVADEDARNYERNRSTAEKLLKALSHDFFSEHTASLAAPHKRHWRGETVDEFPLSMEVAGFPVTGKIVHIPQDLRKDPSGGDPDAGIGADAGERFDIPQGHSIYAWNATAPLSHEDIGRAQALSKEISKHVLNLVQMRLKGEAIHTVHRSDINPGDEQPVAVSQGVFTSPMDPDMVKTALSEKLGIRSILPKSVAEDGNFNNHLTSILRLVE